MNVYTGEILGELSGLLGSVEIDEDVLSCLLTAGRIFVKGCGRTGFVMNMFAMRLAQLGFETYVVGETTAKKAKAGDLLILGSGSGETESLSAIAGKAKANGLKIVLFTAGRESALAKISDRSVFLRAQAKYDRPKAGVSKQPMGALFEQGLMIYLDSVVLAVMERGKISDEVMRKRHANLE